MTGEDRSLSDADRFALLVNAVEEYAIFLVDPAGNVASWNLGAQRIKGYTAQEIVGRHLSVFYTAADNEAGKPDAAMARASQSGVYREEGWRVRKDGSAFWANVTITAIRDSGGELLGYSKITRDDTDRVQAAGMRQQIELLTERDRLGSELQDSVVRRLFRAGLHLSGASTMTTDARLQAKIDEAVADIDATLQEIRAVVSGLRRNPDLSDPG